MIIKSFNPFPKFRKEKKEVEDPPKKIVEKWMIILKIHKYEGHQDMILRKYKNHIQQQYFKGDQNKLKSIPIFQLQYWKP